MYVMRIDMKILHEIQDMLDEYEEKFGERFIAFNYVDFPGTDKARPGQQYKETLEQALREGKPCRMVSHRYDVIKH